MKKRILAITVLLCFALSLSACGQQPAATAPSAAAAPTDGAAGPILEMIFTSRSNSAALPRPRIPT